MLPSSSSSVSSKLLSSEDWWRVQTKSCTPEELIDILEEPSGGDESYPNEAYNEVYERIYLSDGVTALNISLLKELGITHVLNAAHGEDESLNLINSSKEFYEKHAIDFMGIEAFDITNFNMIPYFEKSSSFIADAKSNGGKVLVHCKQGISRSATLVIAYLIIKEYLDVQNAVRIIRSEREIFPNPGFPSQLCYLNDFKLNLIK